MFGHDGRDDTVLSQFQNNAHPLVNMPRHIFGFVAFEHLYSSRMVAEMKEGKNRNSKRTNSDVT